MLATLREDLIMTGRLHFDAGSYLGLAPTEENCFPEGMAVKR